MSIHTITNDYNYKVEVILSTEHSVEAWDWLHNNIKYENFHWRDAPDITYIFKTEIQVIYFKEESDAAAFKLRWV